MECMGMPRLPFYWKGVYGSYLKAGGFSQGLKPGVYEGHSGPAEAGPFKNFRV